MSKSRYDLRLLPWAGGNEGFVARWYKDATGTGTIGYGFTWHSRVFREWWMKKYGRKMRPGDTITKTDSLMLLRLLIEEDYAPPLWAKLKASGSQISLHAAAASIDMAYNCGAGALKWSWFKQLLAGKIRDAANRYRVTATTSKGRKLAGLVRRRKEGAAILEHNRWPAWVKAPKSPQPRHVENVLPVFKLDLEDFRQGVIWLQKLKFLKASDKTNVEALKAAILKFQRQHPQISNDGIMGRATFAQLQRVMDLQSNAGKTGAAGATGTGAGAVDVNAAASGYGEWIMFGSLTLTAAVLTYLAWTYRDEVKIALTNFRRKL